MRQRGRSFRAIALAAVVFVAYLCISSFSTFNLRTTDFWHSGGVGRFTKAHSNPLQSPKLIAFWLKFANVLADVKPQIERIRPTASANTKEEEDVDLEGAKTHSRFNMTQLSESELAEMKRSHQTMVSMLPSLVADFTFDRGSRGVVMTTGGKHLGVAITSIRMLRRVGSKLPVQLFLDSWEDYDMEICEKMLPKLDAKCYVFSEIWDKTPTVTKLLKYQFKTFALLFSSFQHVLLLDADAFPAHDPDTLLETEPYSGAGLITWPDFWISTTSHLFYDIAGIPAIPLETRRSSESGIILFNKEQHTASLMLATYYNYYGPDHYYPLLSQGAAGEGDKETFIHAAIVLGEPFYDVKTPVSVMGANLDGEFHSTGMKQADPMEDYRLHNGERSQKQGITARPQFIHNNMVKLDVRHLFHEDWWNKKGSLSRLWGDSNSVVKDFGYDVEAGLWQEMISASCALGSEECLHARAYAAEVFGSEL